VLAAVVAVGGALVGIVAPLFGWWFLADQLDRPPAGFGYGELVNPLIGSTGALVLGALAIAGVMISVVSAIAGFAARTPRGPVRASLWVALALCALAVLSWGAEWAYVISWISEIDRASRGTP
jgi:hypothetical protein